MKKIQILALLVFSALALHADWRDDMWSAPASPRSGVTLRAYSFDAPRPIKAYVARIDLSTPGIGWTVTGRAEGWGKQIEAVTNRICLVETKRETTAEFMTSRRNAGLNVELAFNTTPWRPFPAPQGCEFCDPRGLVVADGVEVSKANGKDAVFLVRKDGSCQIGRLDQISTNDIAFAAAAFDLILTNGVDAATVTRVENDIHPRTALGLTADRKTLVVLIVDGRQDGYSIGADMADLRAILRREGVTDAVNMDGGGSTSLVVWDRRNARPYMVNRHKNRSSRRNAVNFGITFPEDDIRAVERTAGVYHSYEFTPVEDIPAPDGFAPFYIGHYGRHGSRRLTSSFIYDPLKVLKRADADNALTPVGRRLLADLIKIANVHDGMVGQLSERGAEEHRRLARRMAARFPYVFADARRVRCQSGIFPRVLSSELNFTMALKDAAPSLDFDFITGEKFQRLVNGPHFAVEGSDFEEKVKDAINDLARKEIDLAGILGRIFANDCNLKNANKFVLDLFTCASICQCLRYELGGFDIYQYFTAEEIDALSRVLSARHYAAMANSAEFGDVLVAASRNLAQDFIARADEAIQDDRIAADLHFGHDSGLWPLAAVFGLEGPGDKVPFAESWRLCPASKWLPMAANLQMVLYRNKDGEVLAKFLFNEKEMRLRGIEPASWPYYRWNDVKSILLTPTP